MRLLFLLINFRFNRNLFSDLFDRFFFHITTAYAILRNQGVQLGKPDWVPHMFAYIRPGTLPGG